MGSTACSSLRESKSTSRPPTGATSRTRLAVVGLELLLIYATFGYPLDRETSGIRWPGAVSLLRISQDKVFLAFLLAPAAAMFGAEWLARGERRWLDLDTGS